MIVLQEKRDDVNVIHLIMGPETAVQMEMHGHVMMDISDQIQLTDGGPWLIQLNKCSSEQGLINILRQSNEAEEVPETNPSGTGYQTPATPSQTPEQQAPLCPLCMSESCTVTPDKQFAPCKSCIEIQAGLKSNIPPPPGPEDQKQILKDLMKDNPQQFRDMLRGMLEDDDDE